MNRHDILNRLEFIEYPTLLLSQTIHELSNSLKHTTLPDRQKLNSFVCLLDWIGIDLLNQFLLILF
ncbi:hypothetical protein D3C77_747530 [compost metagenome]